MDWKVPVTTAAVYFFTVTYINRTITRSLAAKKQLQKSLADVVKANKATDQTQTQTTTTRDSTLFKFLVFLHNVALCVFSGACFVGMAPRWIRNFSERSFFDAYCDRDSSVWNSGLFYWSWLFYLSKYWEILDTIILLMKGRPSSLLQSYHHAGAIITIDGREGARMERGRRESIRPFHRKTSRYTLLIIQKNSVRSQATATWIFVLFNSFIHTLMYFYYALTTLGLHPPRRAKKMLTTMQISQFLVGGTMALSYVLIPGCLKHAGGAEDAGWEGLAYGSTIGYLVPLTWLFVDFARRTYANMSKKAAERKVAAGKTAFVEAELVGAVAPAAEGVEGLKRRTGRM
ncbi:hypothetical protein HK101_008358 [Irineochytrium annulatum]|nr:hypothetical protein HK101_008358 [Irineochytrium annulatum]